VKTASALALAGLLAIVPPASAAHRDGEVVTYGADCGASGCRAGGTSIDIKGADGRDYSIPVARSPYVLADGTIVIYPGESLVFEIPGGDTPGTPHLLADGASAGPGAATLTLNYSVRDTMMELNISNGFDKSLKLDAYLGSPRGDSWSLHYTSSCTVLPHIFDMESWPAPLGPIFISNIRYLPAGGTTMTCD